jgi:hypothetical protein
MALAFGAGESLFEEPFTYTNGPLENAAAWDGGIFGDDSLVVAGNVLTCTNGAGQSNSTVASFGDADYGITVPAVGADVSEFYFCFQDNANYYSFMISGGLFLYRVVATVYGDQIADSGLTPVNSGDKIGVRKIGSSLSLMLDSGAGWAEIDTATDATYSSGKFGIWTDSTDRTYDDLFIRSSEAPPAGSRLLLGVGV